MDTTTTDKHNRQAMDRQEWQKRRYPHARSDSDSWDIYAGETLIVCDLMEDECDKIITAHNAALAAGRQRREQAEQQILNRESRWEEIEKLYDYGLAQQVQLREQLLSAQAAIENKNDALRLALADVDGASDWAAREFCHTSKIRAAFKVQPDLSLLHQHDAEVREEGYRKGCDDTMITVAEVRRPLVDALSKIGQLTEDARIWKIVKDAVKEKP